MVNHDKLETWHEEFLNRDTPDHAQCPYADCYLKNKFVQCGNHSHILCYIYKQEYYPKNRESIVDFQKKYF